MRFWLAVLILFGGFAAAVLWQTRWTSRLRGERDRAWAGTAFTEVDAAAPAPPGELPLVRVDPPPPRADGVWARVVVGRPSGAEPVAPPPLQGDAPAGRSGLGSTPLEPAFTTTVRPGQSLSVICQQHYGSARSELVRALATYNGLDDPDRIQVGTRIELPPEQHLLDEQ